MKRITAISLLIVAISFSACRVDDAGDDAIRIGVDEELTLDLVQTLNQGISGLEASFVSNTPYACRGAGYDYSFYTSPVAIQIHLQSVVLPQPCLDGPAPAREQITLPHAEGIYNFNLVIGDLIQNSGKLKIDAVSYTLTMNELHGITLTHDKMYKIPKNIIWGYVHHMDRQYEAQQIAQSFFEPITDEAVLQHGYYGFFNATGSNSVVLSLPSLKLGSKSFAYHYNGDSASLAADVALLNQQLPEGTEMKVFSWTGSTY